jgi:hypothetical protein
VTSVTTQAELDVALADEACSLITINSPRGVWLSLSASGSATVRASGSATVRASGSATVEAYYSATVEASSHVAVHLHSASATIAGGVVINISTLDLAQPATWADYHGVEVEGGEAVLYKATGPDLMTGQEYGSPTVWAIGAVTVAPDWLDSRSCGHGLHISPRPAQARHYRPSSETGTRYLKVAVTLDGLRPLGADKAKARSVRVLAEVDINGNEVTQ